MPYSLNLPGSIRVLVGLPVDAVYYNTSGTPYADVAQALAQIPAGIRYQGLIVNVAGVEYAFIDGIEDIDLVAYNGLGGFLSILNSGNATVNNLISSIVTSNALFETSIVNLINTSPNIVNAITANTGFINNLSNLITTNTAIINAIKQTSDSMANQYFTKF